MAEEPPPIGTGLELLSILTIVVIFVAACVTAAVGLDWVFDHLSRWVSSL